MYSADHHAEAPPARLSNPWVTTPKRLPPDELAEIRTAFVETPEGKSLMRDGARGLLAEIDALRALVTDTEIFAAQHLAARKQAEARSRDLEAALRCFANRGLRHDLNPTNGHVRDWWWWSAYLKHADGMVRERARAALAAASSPADPPPAVEHLITLSYHEPAYEAHCACGWEYANTSPALRERAIEQHAPVPPAVASDGDDWEYEDVVVKRCRECKALMGNGHLFSCALLGKGSHGTRGQGEGQEGHDGAV